MFWWRSRGQRLEQKLNHIIKQQERLMDDYDKILEKVTRVNSQLEALKVRDEAIREQLRQALSGVHLSDEEKAKIAAIDTALSRSEDTIKAINEGTPAAGVDPAASA